MKKTALVILFVLFFCLIASNVVCSQNDASDKYTVTGAFTSVVESVAEARRLISELSAALREGGDKAKKATENYEQLKNLITENFGTDAEDAFERLSKFLETQSSVSWVLFSHTTQFIPFKEVNPLIGYIPREARVFIQETNEEMIEEGGLGD